MRSAFNAPLFLHVATGLPCHALNQGAPVADKGVTLTELESKMSEALIKKGLGRGDIREEDGLFYMKTADRTKKSEHKIGSRMEVKGKAP